MIKALNKEELKKIIRTDVEILDYKNDEDWQLLRQGGLGGSDVGAILGVNKYRSAVDVYLSKIENKKVELNNAIYWGTTLEPVIREEFSKKNEGKFNVFEVDFTFKDGIMLSNVDGMIYNNETKKYGVLEIKTANQFVAKDWDNEMIPQSYYAQVQHYLGVTGLEFGIVAVLIGGSDYREFYVERNEEDIETIRKACSNFWEMYIIPEELPSPDGSDAYSEYQLQKLEKKELFENKVELNADYDRKLEERFDIQERIKELDVELKKINQEVMDILLKADTTMGESEGYKVKIVTQNRTKVDKKEFENNCKELIEKYKEEENKYKIPTKTHFIKVTRKGE